MEAIEMLGITKKFGCFTANDHIDFSLKKGEIHALLGENGAGKSTLMNILYGIYSATEGKILISGKEVQITSPRVAISHGVGMVHQHFMLVSNFTVAENMILGMHKRTWLNIRQVENTLRELSERYGLKVNPKARISTLSVGEQERVEIMKALYRKVDVLILDEPTAVLTPQETEDLFTVLRNLAKSGVSIIIITHKLEEVMAVTDRVTVLRMGKKITTVQTNQTDKKELARMMVGRDVLLDIPKPEPCTGKNVLELKDVSCTEHGTKKLNGISLCVREGEILGIAGVDGNGQRELSRVVAGLLSTDGGEIHLNGRRINGESIAKIIREGVSYIPEDRLKDGLLGEFSIEDNFIIQTLHRFTKYRLFDKKRIRNNALQLITEYDIRANGPAQPTKLLSGGNQQKLIFARELGREPKLLLAAQPTRGLDIGATEFVWKRIMEAKKKGVAVLLISTELDEILTLSDRVLVFYEGKTIGSELKPDLIDVAKIGLLMAGVEQEGDKCHAHS